MRKVAIVLLVLGLLAVGLLLLVLIGENSAEPSTSSISDNLDYGLPSDRVKVVERIGYALGYNEDWRISEWVCYRLTRDEALSNVCERATSFVKDPAISNNYATASDYARSGFDKGHLAPAADMQWSSRAMSDSFYMSNMTPQTPMFNRGIWKQLEKWVRDVAIVETNIFIVTGPIVTSNDLANTIGANRVVVPSAFYKVVLDETPPCKMIGFVISNRGYGESISNFVVTVDEVESVTDLDFFKRIPDDEEEEMESKVDFSNWRNK